MGLGFGIWSSGFEGLGFRVCGLGFRVQGLYLGRKGSIMRAFGHQYTLNSTVTRILWRTVNCWWFIGKEADPSEDLESKPSTQDPIMILDYFEELYGNHSCRSS